MSFLKKNWEIAAGTCLYTTTASLSIGSNINTGNTALDYAAGFTAAVLPVAMGYVLGFKNGIDNTKNDNSLNKPNNTLTNSRP